MLQMDDALCKMKNESDIYLPNTNLVKLETVFQCKLIRNKKLRVDTECKPR